MAEESKFKAHNIVGLILLATFISYIWRDWDVAKGVLLDHWIEYETTQGEITMVKTGPVSWARWNNFDIKVWYGYRVDGELYISDIINFDRNMSRVDHYLEKYPVGQEVTVFYQRGNPEFAVLEPEIWSTQVIQSIVISLFLLSGYLFLWLLCPIFNWCVRFMEKFYEFGGGDDYVEHPNKRMQPD